MFELNDSQAYQMELDKFLGMLQFQIFAFMKAKEANHQALMSFNLNCIREECHYLDKFILDEMLISQKRESEWWEMRGEKS